MFFDFFLGVMKGSRQYQHAVTTTGCFAGRTLLQRLSIPGFALFSSYMYLDTGNFLLKSASSFSNSAENKLLLFDLLLHFVCVKLYFHVYIVFIIVSQSYRMSTQKTNELIKNYEINAFEVMKSIEMA
jgi:hypothetical protein